MADIVRKRRFYFISSTIWWCCWWFVVFAEWQLSLEESEQPMKFHRGICYWRIERSHWLRLEERLRELRKLRWIFKKSHENLSNERKFNWRKLGKWILCEFGVRCFYRIRKHFENASGVNRDQVKVQSDSKNVRYSNFKGVKVENAKCFLEFLCRLDKKHGWNQLQIHSCVDT